MQMAIQYSQSQISFYYIYKIIIILQQYFTFYFNYIFNFILLTILPNILNHQEIDKLLQRTNDLVEKADLVNNQMFFDTKNAPRGMSFLDTASKIGYLLELGMIDEKGQIKVKDKKLALNKIGHAMHDLDPVFEKFSYNNIFKAVLKDVYIDPILAQTMVIFKNQKFGTAVDMHTDNTYIISEPKLSCIGLWIALEDATKNNGCMYAFPKSHLTPTTYFNVLLSLKFILNNMFINHLFIHFLLIISKLNNNNLLQQVKLFVVILLNLFFFNFTNNKHPNYLMFQLILIQKTYKRQLTNFKKIL